MNKPFTCEMNSTFKRMTAIIVVLVLCLMFAMPAFASTSIRTVIRNFYTLGNLGLGSSGKYVKVIQRVLSVYPYTSSTISQNGGIDGSYGSATRSAVITFQNNYGLTADGVVGQQTWSTVSNALVLNPIDYNATYARVKCKYYSADIIWVWYPGSSTTATSNSQWNLCYTSGENATRLSLFTGETPQ